MTEPLLKVQNLRVELTTRNGTAPGLREREGERAPVRPRAARSGVRRSGVARSGVARPREKDARWGCSARSRRISATRFAQARKASAVCSADHMAAMRLPVVSRT